MTPAAPAVAGGPAAGLPLWRLLAYAAPGLPLAALTLPVFILIPDAYGRLPGLDLASVGVALMVARLWDPLSDPLAGWLSDRTRSRLGRRLPWVLVGLLPTLLATWQLFHPPETAGVWYLLGWSLLLYTGWTLMIVPLLAWGAELEADYDRRTRVMAVREGMILAGLLAALVVAGLFQDARGPSLSAVAWLVMIGLPISVAVLVACAPRPPPQDTAARPLTWAEGWRALRANRPFRRLLVAFLVNGVANGIPAVLFLPFLRHALEAEHQAGLLLILYFLVAAAGLPLWLWLSRRVDKHRAWIAAMLLACVAFAPAPLLNAGDLGWFVAITAVTGLCVGADLALTSAMQADVIDLDRAATGHERAGLYMALWGTATKLAQVLALVVLPLLGWLWAADVPAAGAAGAQDRLALALAYAALPVALKLGAVALMAGYPLTRSAIAEARRAADDAGSPGSA